MHILVILLIVFIVFLIKMWRKNHLQSRRISQLESSAYGRRYKEIFENSSDAIFVIEVSRSGKFCFESLNPVAEQIFNAEGGCLVHKAFEEIIAMHSCNGELPGILHELADHLVQSVASGLPQKFESTFAIAAGVMPGTYDFNLMPMADDGGITHLLCFARDVTTRKLYEQALMKQAGLEDKLSGFAASAPGYFYTYRHGMDGSNAMPFASTGINELFGLYPEDVAQDISPMSLRIHQDDLRLFIQATAYSAAYMTPLLIEFRAQHPDKGEIWVESRAMPKTEANGDVVMHGFMHDVTERKRVEKTLMESELRYQTSSNLLRSILESPPDIVIYALDKDYRYLAFNEKHNKTALTIWGKEISIGMNNLEVMGELPDREVAKQGYDWVLSGNDLVLEGAFGDAHLSREYWQNFGSPIYSDVGDVIGLTVFALNISERRRMEEALRVSNNNLAEAQRISRLGSWELDLASGALRWSDEIYRIFEIDPALFGATYEAFLEAIHPDDRAAVNSAYTESLKNRTAYCIDHRLLFADGRIKFVRECCETNFDDFGNPQRSYGTVQDITALKVTEQKLQDTHAKLRELVLSREALREEERKRISWEMHEELGQFLAAMKMHIYAMRNQWPKDNVVLKESGISMIMLIDKSIKTVRDLVSELRPTALLLGIVPALEWLVGEFNNHPDIVCELGSVDETSLVSDELTILVFRIAQESLEIIIRCAGVSRVHVAWKVDQRGHVLSLRHDGRTISGGHADEQALSLFGLQERMKAYGGEISIYTELDSYSVIEAYFPMQKAIEFP